jgi:hypothetical protein
MGLVNQAAKEITPLDLWRDLQRVGVALPLRVALIACGCQAEDDAQHHIQE